MATKKSIGIPRFTVTKTTAKGKNAAFKLFIPATEPEKFGAALNDALENAASGGAKVDGIVLKATISAYAA